MMGFPTSAVSGDWSGTDSILIAASYRWPVYAPAFATALENLGLRVTRFAFEKHLKGRTARFQIRLGLGPAIRRVNRELVLAVKRARPSICLIWTGLPIWPETIKQIRALCWVTSYTNDDPFGPRGSARFWHHFRDAIPEYHSHHVYRNENVSEYQALGAQYVEILRSYYVPWLHYPMTRNLGVNKESVTFIGHGEPFRVELLSKLALAGIPVDVYGPGETWRSLGRLAGQIRHASGTLDSTEYRQTISNATICLGLLSRRNRDTYTRRYFEIPACGGFLLAERTNVALSLYEEEKEAEYFSSIEEAVAKCTQYLQASERRQQIALEGTRRCQESGYDVGSRALGWYQDIIRFRS